MWEHLFDQHLSINQWHLTAYLEGSNEPEGGGEEVESEDGEEHGGGRRDPDPCQEAVAAAHHHQHNVRRAPRMVQEVNI